MWWRTLAAVVFSIPLLTVPAVLVWINKWGAANILIEACERRGNTMKIDQSVSWYVKLLEAVRG
jgi:hypothetical protein